MDELNYHHLRYFFSVAREGGVAAASRALGLSPATISSQVKALEQSLGERLFERAGRRLVLTDRGRLVYSYAESIFALGNEIRTALQVGSERPLRFAVGIADVVPKLIAHHLLQPVFDLPQEVQLVCKEGKVEHLLQQLSSHELDIIISDTPVRADAHVRSFNHLLGECSVTFFASPRLARRLGPEFPACLDEAPILLPTRGTMLRHSLDHWFSARGLHPWIVGEFEDSALLKVFGQSELGAFGGPSIIEEDISRQYGVEILGRTEEVKERFYALTLERRMRHPAVLCMSDRARRSMFT